MPKSPLHDPDDSEGAASARPDLASSQGDDRTVPDPDQEPVADRELGADQDPGADGEPGAEPEPVDAPPPPRGWRRVGLWAKRITIVLAVLLGLSLIGIALAIRHFEAGLPSTQELRNYNPPQVTRVLARDGTLLGEIFVERRTLVSITTIPSEVKLAVLAAEDASFYEHDGLNYLGMLRALEVNLRSTKSRQGGSTITQQVIKNLVLSPERTYERKIREGLLARRIEQELTKDEILELYLNHINFGHGRYGVEEGSRHYFGKSVRDLTLGQASLLAGIPKGPSIYSPRVDLARSMGRRARVLEQMVNKGFATPEQAEAAKNEPVVLAPEIEALPELAPEVVEEARRELRRVVGPSADRGGYVVTTTIDPAMQMAARAAVRKNLDDYGKRHKLIAPLTLSKNKKAKEPAPFEGTPKPGSKVYLGVVTGADDTRGTITVRVGTTVGTINLAEVSRYNPKGLLPSQFAEVGKVVRVSVRAMGGPSKTKDPAPPDPDADEQDPAPPKEPRAKEERTQLHLELGPQGALYAIDIRTREVVALVGSYEAVRAGLDRSTQAHRQPGSTFKPFVYSYAIHTRAMTPATILETSPTVMGDYRPENYDESEGKSPKRLREALAHSVNVAAVWSLNRVGPANVVAWSHALGIESKLGPDLSLALGSYEVTPREMASAYATIASGGTYEAPVLITRIIGPAGVEIPLPARPAPRRVMEEPEAYVVTSLLTSVVETGTGKRARAIGRPIAGKTGTSNQAKDAWFAGYSTDIACVVWTGYDDAVPLGAGEAGSSAALPAFVDFMRQAHLKRPPADFPVPAGITRISIDPATGLRAYPDQENAFDEVFLAGTEPHEVATPEEDAGAPAGEGDAPDAGALVPVSPDPSQANAPPSPDAPPF